MMDSLPYRNDAAIVFRRLIRSLPRRKGVLGVATCDKGLPAMMMALAGSKHLPCVLVPGGVTLPPRDGEDAGKIQIDRRPLRPRRAVAWPRPPSWAAAPAPARRRLPVPRHRRHVAGRRRGARADAPARGARALRPADLARHGPPLGAALRRPARSAGSTTRRHPRPTRSIRNAMIVHAAFGGSTNLLLHIPAIAFAAGLRRPTVDDWHEVNVKVPRLVERAAQRPGRPSDGPRLPRRRRARGDAPPARARPARPARR